MAGSSAGYAHTPPYLGGPWHPISTHLLGVESLATQFAEPLGLIPEASLAALLHDLGKYGDLFQKRLLGQGAGIDHWSAGAWIALTKYVSKDVGLAVQGHHIGLQRADKASLLEIDPNRQNDPRTLSEKDFKLLLDRHAQDGLKLPTNPLQRRNVEGANNMLRTRMLFSTLVDADFLDTESHFVRTTNGPKILRPSGPELEYDRSLQALDRYIGELQSRATPKVKTMREQVMTACVTAGDLPAGLFTLTAPTGSGKTLAMLRFALLQAKKNRLRRIVVVLPFLTLIEQTAAVYRSVFRDFGDDYVLEDHSLARDVDQPGEREDRLKLLAENWDAPIVITSNVRFFESLHQNRPAACRKLHRLAKSVVLCDEVQTIPLSVTIPASLTAELSSAERKEGVSLTGATLASVASLAKDFKSTVLFATATQPAFAEFDCLVQKVSSHSWAPQEVVKEVEKLFADSARVKVDWRFDPESWETLASEIERFPGTLVIVNTRGDAANLAELLIQRVNRDKMVHLSTNMCVAHRQLVLQKVKSEDIESTGYLIATQCVEAGVDLDFNRVYRAWAPLDSIAQAAGRCNRNGRQEVGEVVVFLPENPRYPLGGYEQAMEAAQAVVREMGPTNAKLHDPTLFDAYYKRLYRNTGIAKRESVLEKRIEVADFVDVAALYRLIADNGENLVVRIGDALGQEHRARNEELLDKLVKEGLSKRLMRKLRPYTVTTFLNRKTNIAITELKTNPGPLGEVVRGWGLVDSPKSYDPFLGLILQAASDSLIA